MASTYLERNMTGNTASTKMTFSCWLKKSNPATDGRLFGAQALACHSYWLSTGELRVDFSQKDSGSVVAALKTNRKFRDVNAWYHIVFALDTTLGTADDRIKLWVNGVQETSFDVRTNASQNATYAYGQSGYYTVGARTSNQGGAGHYFDGLMSHVHYCDGYAYTPSEFGSTDATTGEWKINTSPSVSYGTNGFFLLKDNNSANDQSGNSNNFTASGNLTFTHDNPSNVFCALNPVTGRSTPTYSLGNLKTTSSSDGHVVFGTIGSKAGYYEIKLGQNPNGGNGNGLTFGTFDSNFSDNNLDSTNRREYKTNHGYTTNYSIDIGNGAGTTTGVSAAAGDIINVAWKNGKLYCGKNGTYFFSANPSNNTDGSTQVTLNDSSAYQLPISKSNIDGMTNSEWNFGNGYFGTTAITSNSGNGYQDANGQGKFQYQPPTGCYALCTKNLNI